MLVIASLHKLFSHIKTERFCEGIQPMPYTPTVRGRRLARELRRIREELKLTVYDTADAPSGTKPW
jgi:hypothetical protein